MLLNIHHLAIPTALSPVTESMSEARLGANTDAVCHIKGPFRHPSVMTHMTEGQPHIEGGSLGERLELHHLDTWGWSLACCNHDKDLAHDVLHEAYVRVLEGRARYRAESSFKTWLFGVIRLVAQEGARQRLSSSA